MEIHNWTSRRIKAFLGQSPMWCQSFRCSEQTTLPYHLEERRHALVYLFVSYCLFAVFVWGQLEFNPKWLTPSPTSNLPPLSPSESSLPWSKLFVTCSLTNCIYLDDLMFLICLHIHWLQDLPFQNRRFPWHTALPSLSNTNLLLTLKLKL